MSDAEVLPRAARFVGRRHELRALGELLAEVGSTGAGSSAAIVGEPGIGKTSLVRELIAEAETSGFAVLGGRGSEFEQDVPFGLVIDALDRPIGELGPDVADHLGEERVAELATVFPSLSGRGRHLPRSLEIERFRCHFAVRAALELLAETRPLLLVLDDLHWADPDSLELVAHLLRREPRSTMVVTVSRRNAPLLRTGVERETRTFELGPLPGADLARSIGRSADSTQVREAYDQSGGNPFYFAELIRSSPLPAGSRPDAVPASVRAAIHRELDALSAPARRLAQAAAVVGEPFDVDLTAAVAELAEPAMLSCLDELVSADLVQPTDTPSRMAFRHPIIRRAVYDVTGHGLRLGAHRRTAAELAVRGGSLLARAHHVDRSGNVGDEDAVALLTEAGQATALRAPAAAARWFAGALRLLPAAAPSRRIDLLLPLAAAHAAAGHPQESREILEHARSTVDPADRATRRRILALLAGAEQALGRSREALPLLSEALGQAEPGSAEAVAVTIDLAMNHVAAGELREAVLVAAEAAEAARRIGDQALVASAMVVNGLALLNVGESEVAAARRHIQQASDFFSRLPDDELTQSHLTTLATLALVESLFRRWVRAERIAERGLRLARESGRGDVYLPFMLALLSAATMKGEQAGTGPLIDEAAEAAVLTGNDQWLAPIEGMRCRYLLQRGRPAEALVAGQNGVRAAQRAPRSMFWYVAHAFYGAALIEDGRHEQGRRELYRLGGPTLADIPPTSRTFWRNVLVRSYLATGEVESAAELVDLMERTETEQGQLMHAGEARDARAGVLLATGDPAAAASAALEAASIYETAEMYVDAARARTLAGRALLAAGSTAAGERELTRAHAALTERGAARLADEAAGELRSLGIMVRRRSKPRAAAGGVGSLSDREREVAELAAEGRTNRQIAEALSLSPKTVETHLARIYTKLAVRSRTAMVATLGTQHEPPTAWSVD